MPGAPDSAKMGEARSLSKGGTSAVEPSTPVGLIAGGVCVLVAVVVAVVVFTRGDGDPKSDGTTDESGERAARVTAGSASSDAGANDEDEELSPARGSNGSAVRIEALAALADQLKSERLWSDVATDRLDANTLVVRTQYCDDERLRSTVSDLRDTLSAAGFTALKCFEQHGALVFEESF